MQFGGTLVKNNYIAWCIKQPKGIKIESPNNTISLAYLKKVKSALRMLDAALQQNEREWIVATAYYARYFSLYALLQKWVLNVKFMIAAYRLWIYLLSKA